MGMVMVMRPILNFWAPSDISGIAEVRVVKFCMQVEYIVLALGR